MPELVILPPKLVTGKKEKPPSGGFLQSVEKVQQMLCFFSCIWYNRVG